mgnify:CR=1 FL=1
MKKNVDNSTNTITFTFTCLPLKSRVNHQYIHSLLHSIYILVNIIPRRCFGRDLHMHQIRSRIGPDIAAARIRRTFSVPLGRRSMFPIKSRRRQDVYPFIFCLFNYYVYIHLPVSLFLHIFLVLYIIIFTWSWKSKDL